MTYEQVKNEMSKIERELLNTQNSFNPESGKHIQHEQNMGRLMDEYLKHEVKLMLLAPYDEIEYTDILSDDSGQIMSLHEFKTRCGLNEFDNDSGVAFYVHNDTRSLETFDVYLRPSWALSNLHRKDFNEIIWYKNAEFETDNQVSDNESFEDIEEDF